MLLNVLLYLIHTLLIQLPFFPTIEMCHAKILQKCGSAVIEGFAENNLPLYQKCRIREVQ